MSYDKRKLDQIRGFVGEGRRSKLVMGMGPGAIVDLVLRPTGEPVSGVVAGLEEWPTTTKIREFRLERRHKLQFMVAPPVRKDDDENDARTLPVVRFPRWLQCPKCQQVRREDGWARNPHDIHHAGRYCTSCRDTEGKLVAVMPVRFVVACQDGHLDDFPFQRWIGCTCEPRHARLRLEQRSAGLAGLHLSCTLSGCPGEVGRSMQGAFGAESLKRIGYTRCRGWSPWIGTLNKDCDCEPRVIQRGASNAYWSKVDSALSIPPFTNPHAQALEGYVKSLEVFRHLEDMLTTMMTGFAQTEGVPLEYALAFFRAALGGQELDAQSDLALEEYEQFMRLRGLDEIDEGEFLVRRVDGLNDALEPVVDVLVQAERLREVRLLEGFTRIYPPSGSFASGEQSELASLSRARLGWLPAVELRGEGIFLALQLDAVREWEARPVVQERVEQIRTSMQTDLFENEEPPEQFGARLLLLHSLAHVLITQLTLECGYSSSSLTERLYVGGGPSGGADMVGLLIYTGTPDADGTLGGLVAQGAPERFYNTFMDGLRNAQWCSSDPLCISDVSSLSSPRNGAACHSCLLIAETSCVHFNRYLDRAMLVGQPGVDGLGFFEHLLNAR